MADVDQGSVQPPSVPVPGLSPGLEPNGTDVLNATAKFVATPEGTALAYGSLLFMALLPIFFGALRSVTCSKSKVPPVPGSSGGPVPPKHPGVYCRSPQDQGLGSGLTSWSVWFCSVLFSWRTAGGVLLLSLSLSLSGQ